MFVNLYDRLKNSFNSSNKLGGTDDPYLEETADIIKELIYEKYDNIFNMKTEQLTSTGLALLMFLYAEKEKDINQPFIAYGPEALEKVANLVDNSDVGTEITVVFQAGENVSGVWARTFGSAHKTTLKLIKTDTGIDVIHMDAIENESYMLFPNMLIMDELEKNAKDNRKEPSILHSYEPKISSSEDESILSIQYDEIRCGVFASKFARKLVKHEPTDLRVDAKAIYTNPKKTGWKKSDFNVPMDFLKYTQSNTARDKFESASDNKNRPLNPRTNLTFSDIKDKYKDAKDYIKHFNHKQIGMIEAYLKKKPTLKEILEAASVYNADNLTAERLADINKLRVKSSKPSI